MGATSVLMWASAIQMSVSDQITVIPIYDPDVLGTFQNAICIIQSQMNATKKTNQTKKTMKAKHLKKSISLYSFIYVLIYKDVSSVVHVS